MPVMEARSLMKADQLADKTKSSDKLCFYTWTGSASKMVDAKATLILLEEVIERKDLASTRLI